MTALPSGTHPRQTGPCVYIGTTRSTERTGRLRNRSLNPPLIAAFPAPRDCGRHLPIKTSPSCTDTCASVRRVQRVRLPKGSVRHYWLVRVEYRKPSAYQLFFRLWLLADPQVYILPALVRLPLHPQPHGDLTPANAHAGVLFRAAEIGPRSLPRSFRAFYGLCASLEYTETSSTWPVQ
jgi:hypothetical protein